MDYSPEYTFYEFIRRIPKVEAQNALMRVPDRELSMCLLFLTPEEREVVYTVLSPSKADRVADELTYQEHLQVKYEKAMPVIRRVLSRIGATGPSDRGGTTRSYIRPRKRR